MWSPELRRSLALQPNTFQGRDKITAARALTAAREIESTLFPED